MALILESITLPCLPDHWPTGQAYCDHGVLTAPAVRTLVPAGQWFEAYASRHRRGRTLSVDDVEEKPGGEMPSEASSDSEEEPEVYTGPADPTKPKELDPYSLLGLGKLRWRATEEQIKSAYRKMVLKHHPDKLQKTAEGLDDDNLFKCIKIANDILSDPVQRRGYDSIDPNFDDEIPVPSKGPMDAETFFTTYGPVFEVNGRFSESQPAPSLGSMESSQDDVENFYDFWYSFKSWREFTYEDEEKAENRLEKRWLEREKRAERKQKKQEENQRISRLVDNAFKADPRLQLWKERERQEKEAKRQARQAALKAEKEAAEKAKMAERLAKEKAEKEAQVLADAERKKRDEQRRQMKGLRKSVRQFSKNSNFYDGWKAGVDQVAALSLVDVMLERLSLADLVDITSDLTVERLRQELDKRVDLDPGTNTTAPSKQPITEPTAVTHRQWSDEEDELLVKAVKIYPAGTRKRWATIASYINARLPSADLTGDDVLAKVKERQNIGKSLNEKRQEGAYHSFEKQNKLAEASVTAVGGLSVRYDGPKAANENGTEWTIEQQKALEVALRASKDMKTGRFDWVADQVPGRTKKECLARCKELAQAVKAKKAQQTSS